MSDLKANIEGHLVVARSELSPMGQRWKLYIDGDIRDIFEGEWGGDRIFVKNWCTILTGSIAGVNGQKKTVEFQATQSGWFSVLFRFTVDDKEAVRWKS